MKNVPCKLLYGSFLTICLLLRLTSVGQGRVVVNEFMAWSGTGGGCTGNSEFIELLNFGPGPMNIGCYVVTNGRFAVTIPAGTILQPGQYYVLAGQDVLPAGCANTDSLVHTDLNWSTCGCMTPSTPLYTPDGYLLDGGSANEKVVLLDANFQVVDAVSRYALPSASDGLTTTGSTCTPRSFDLDNMGVSYESIGEAQGTGNSYSRRVDGDCSWMKTPAVSARAPNKTGSTSSTTYSFSTISATECAEKAGWISIQVDAGGSEAALFPMNYTLAFDRDNDGVFEDSDQYTYGTDNTAPSIDISNLAYGRYRITVASALGCNLKNFDFTIFNCYGVVLPLRLVSFTYTGLRGLERSFKARFSEAAGSGAVYLEGSAGDGIFQAVSERHLDASSGELELLAPPSPMLLYRLKIAGEGGLGYYSQELKVPPLPSLEGRVWPTPSADNLKVAVRCHQAGLLNYTVLGPGGMIVLKGVQALPAQLSTFQLPVKRLPPGLYFLRLEGPLSDGPLTLRFVRQ